jgi:hypothetical protein
MKEEEFSSHELKRCVLKVGDVCTGRCSSCNHKEAVRDVLIDLGMSPGDILAMDEVP